MKKPFPILPHELAFGLYFIVMWVRLVFATGFFARDSLIYLGSMVLNAVLIVRCICFDSDRNWRWRLLFYPIAMNVFYLLSRTAVPAVHPQLEDAALQALDKAMIGGNLSRWLEPLIHPVLTDIFSLCYVMFMPYLLLAMAWYFPGDLPRLQRFYSGLFTIYGFGLLGYMLVPAHGPYLAMADQFQTQLEGGFITQLNDKLVWTSSNRVDVFPSLHCAIIAYLLYFDRTHAPTRFKVMLLPCLGLWISTIYLRYHYFVDVVCGFALTALAIWTVKQYEKQRYAIPAHV